MNIALANDPAAVARCFATMRDLRPHLTDEAGFVARVERQGKEGFLLAYLEDDGEVRAVAGYRFIESLSAGKFLYVDDLVSREGERTKGYGGRLFDWLVERAREAGCDTFALDSGVQRFDAHRFYFRKGMHVVAHHFRMKPDANRPERA